MGHVFIPNPIAEPVAQRLRANHEVSLGYGPSAVTWEDVQDRIDATLVRGDMITAGRIESAPRLKIIARHGVGTNNVDLDAAAAQGVWVTTTPGANAQAVAEHVFALLLTLARHTVRAVGNVRGGHWNNGRTELVGAELHGKTLLLIGGGGIARLIIPIAKGFGMEILIHDPYLPPQFADELGVRLLDLDAALPLADVVSIHVPLTPDTENLLDDRRLSLLRPTSYVINTSRGGIVDERALVERLRAGELAGAGLDVIAAEAVDMMEPLPHSDLDAAIPNLIITPHIGGQTDESLLAVGMLAAESIEAVLAGQDAPRAVQRLTSNAGV